METVTVIGVGLIGGSFAVALKKAGFRGRIIGVSSERTINEALELGVIDEGAGMEEGVREADLVYLAQPIRRILEVLGRIDGYLRPGALVTDAGSTKAAIVEHARHVITRAQFLGGHPMAGKETRGVGAADPDLFRGRTYVLTPLSPGDLETEAAAAFAAWIERIGARLLTMAPGEHDRIVSYTSHLAQLASTALAAALADRELSEEQRRTAGPGLMDTTRLAMSPYDVWQDILATNTESIYEALTCYIDKLVEIRENLTGSRLKSQFQIARSFSGKLRGE